MPLNTSSCVLVHSARKHLSGSPRVCEIFNQTLDISDELVAWLISRCDQEPFLNKAILEEMLALGWAGRKPLVRRFYEALGFESWTAIDSHTKNGTLPMDLNASLQRDFNFTEQFDLVNNNGATEHVFDQRAMFENIHNLCKVGGIMTHKCPTLHVMNISFYGVSPAFFYDIAQANRYELIDYRMCNRWGDTVKVRINENDPPPVNDFSPTVPPAADAPTVTELPPELKLADFIELKPFISKSPLPNMDTPVAQTCHTLIERARRFRPNNTGELHIMASFRKVYDEPFKVPYQNIALRDIEPTWFRERYRNQFEAHNLPIEQEVASV
jgi:SAM-dependent methyltransferase